MTTSTHPLHRIADRSYDLLSSVDELFALFKTLGFVYRGAGKADALWQHRWHHDGPGGRTMLVLFKPYLDYPPRLSLLGPKIGEVDALCDATVEQDDAGGTWLAFDGGAR